MSAVIQPGYLELIRPEIARKEIADRVELSFAQYRELHAAHERGSAENYANSRVTKAPYRFVGVRDGARVYAASALPIVTGTWDAV